jgi:hypothetical protein
VADSLPWRDVIFRRRRFAIAIAATALVFALSLLLSGVSASFARETDRTVRDVGGDFWVVREGSPDRSPRSYRCVPSGRINSLVAVWWRPLRCWWFIRWCGARTTPDIWCRTSRFVMSRCSVSTSAGLGVSRIVDGRGIEGGSDAVVDRRLGYDLGDKFPVGSSSPSLAVRVPRCSPGWPTCT